METETRTLDNAERIMSVVSGATLLYNEFKKKDHRSIMKIAMGAYLMQRGVTGKCMISNLVGAGASKLISAAGRLA
jgi:uncharacterized membrane protein